MAYVHDPYDPALGFHFAVIFDIDKAKVNVFQEVSGFSTEIKTEEVKDGGSLYRYALPTEVTYSNLVMKRGLLSKNSGVIKWMNKALEHFEFETTTIIVNLLNEKSQPLVSWNFDKAWPVKLETSGLEAQDSKIVIETMEFKYESFKRELHG